MALPTFSMRQLLEAGVHFGHVTRRWNPKMDQYIFGTRQGIHIIDLQQTVPMLYQAMNAVGEIVAGGGRVLWVGTKRQASGAVAEAAKKCGQYYVNHRWLGGMMTNWKTISNSIKRLKTLEEQLSEENIGLTKKELLRITRERDKLERALGGIKEMGGLPDVVVVVDTNKEAIAVAEANKLGIPVVGIIDSNSNPEGIDYPIPGNDDSIRAINLYCDLLAGAVLSGIQEEITMSGGDIGESEEAPAEELPAEEEVAAEAEAPVAETPAEEAPAESQTPTGEATAEEAPAETEAPTGEATAEEAPAETEAPTGEAPAEEASAETEAPTGEATAEEAPAETEAPTGEAIAEEAPAETEAPTGEATAEEVAAEQESEEKPEQPAAS